MQIQFASLTWILRVRRRTQSIGFFDKLSKPEPHLSKFEETL